MATLQSLKSARSKRSASDLVQFAAKIRAGRAALGWSQTELATQSALTRRDIVKAKKTALAAFGKSSSDRQSKQRNY